jgi:Fe-S oxidoreductase
MAYLELHSWDRCTECGTCLSGCPVMHMPRSEARTAIRDLLAGDLSGRALAECTLCYKCNDLCPVPGLEPTDLLQQRILERRGPTPGHIRYLFNTENGRSIWSEMRGSLTREQHDVLRKWSEPPPPAPEVLWLGCVQRTFSPTDIEHSTVLNALPKYGPVGMCCGEISYRLGGFRDFLAVAEQTWNALRAIKTERLVCYCSGCAYFFDHVYTKVFGEHLPFEVVTIYDWLWERLRDGELTVTQPLEYDAAVCESCNVTELSRHGSPELDTRLRELYQAAGVSLHELEHRGTTNQTCGFAAMARGRTLPASMAAMIREQRKKYRDVRQSGTRNMAINCTGCYLTYGYTNKLFGARLKLMPEELLRAFGDTITEPASEGFKRFFGRFVRRVPSLLVHD